MSRVSNPDGFSSNWHVLPGSLIETFSTFCEMILLTNSSTTSDEQLAGIQTPNVMADPLDALHAQTTSFYELKIEVRFVNFIEIVVKLTLAHPCVVERPACYPFVKYLASERYDTEIDWISKLEV